jgi:hypothetical protein
VHTGSSVRLPACHLRSSIAVDPRVCIIGTVKDICLRDVEQTHPGLVSLDFHSGRTSRAKYKANPSRRPLKMAVPWLSAASKYEPADNMTRFNYDALVPYVILSDHIGRSPKS